MPLLKFLQKSLLGSKKEKFLKKRASGKLNILFQLSGSISCYKSCFLISYLIKEGHHVQVACTPSALKFIGAATLEGLTGSPVISKIFEDSKMMEHIHLTRWADLFILCPASAHTINALAGGLTPHMIGALFLAQDFKKPYLLVPAMNSHMLSHPVTQKSLRSLKSWGVHVLETEFGSMACGETGWGRLLDVEKIQRKIQEHIDSLLQKKKPKPKRSQQRRKKILITAGGTQEPIDSVRYLSNISTGLTGARIAEACSLKGFEVTYLHARSALKPFEQDQSKSLKERPLVCLPFTSFQNFKNQFQSLLQRNHFEAVFHSAALSDYSVQSIEQNKKSFLPGGNWKCSSEHGDLLLRLKKNEKLLNQIKTLSKNKSCYVFAFKFTCEEQKATDQFPLSPPEAVQKMLKQSSVDFVIHNDLNEIKKERQKREDWQENFDTSSFSPVHVFHLYSSLPSKTSPQTFFFKEDLSKHLSQLIWDLIDTTKQEQEDNQCEDTTSSLHFSSTSHMNTGDDRESL